MSGASLNSDLPKGKKYHCNFIYNCAKRKHLETKDTELSLKFVEFLEQRLKCWGYTKCYYYDEHARPGADVFDELFETVESSMWTFVIITEDFSKNLWVKYCQRAVFKTLIDENAGDNPTLIPIVLGSAQYPPELNVKGVLSFRADEETWQGHARELRRLQKTLDEGISVAATAENKPIQEDGDSRVKTARGELVAQPMSLIQENFASLHLGNQVKMENPTLKCRSNGVEKVPRHPKWKP